jgi:hypothetical protein
MHQFLVDWIFARPRRPEWNAVEVVHRKLEIGALIDSLNSGVRLPHQGIVRVYPDSPQELERLFPGVYAAAYPAGSSLAPTMPPFSRSEFAALVDALPMRKSSREYQRAQAEMQRKGLSIDINFHTQKGSQYLNPVRFFLVSMIQSAVAIRHIG